MGRDLTASTEAQTVQDGNEKLQRTQRTRERQVPGDSAGGGNEEVVPKGASGVLGQHPQGKLEGSKEETMKPPPPRSSAVTLCTILDKLYLWTSQSSRED